MILIIIQKWLSRRDKKSADAGAQAASRSIESEIVLIKAGDAGLRDDLLRRYQPYVAKTAARYCHKYIHPETDDEFSIALLAFNEAIDAYNPEAGSSFLGFADTVIRRRLIDYVRKEQKHGGQIPRSAFLSEDEEGSMYDPLDAAAGMDQYQLKRDNEERKLEIEELTRELSEYGISFTDLVEGSPKHEDARRSLISIALLITRDESLYEPLKAKKTLPMKMLSERVHVSRKTLERGRKYMIAVALIHMGNYPYLQSYVAPAAEAHGVKGHATGQGSKARGWEA